MKIPLFAKLALVVLVIGTGAVLSSGWKEMERSKRIEAEVDSLRREADKIRGENRTIGEKIAFFSSESFEEREAKEKLGMKRSDEEAVALDTGMVLGAATPAEGLAADTTRGKLSDTPNYRKWFAYFGLGSDQ
ncbi:MAG TPA: hypothetical protein VN420_04760 [Candidatus Fimivivens sp.]|nr:hypothetical protein [Candidatus Fimivivens sp.]